MKSNNLLLIMVVLTLSGNLFGFEGEGSSKRGLSNFEIDIIKIIESMPDVKRGIDMHVLRGGHTLDYAMPLDRSLYQTIKLPSSGSKIDLRSIANTYVALMKRIDKEAREMREHLARTISESGQCRSSNDEITE